MDVWAVLMSKCQDIILQINLLRASVYRIVSNVFMVSVSEIPETLNENDIEPLANKPKTDNTIFLWLRLKLIKSHENSHQTYGVLFIYSTTKCLTNCHRPFNHSFFPCKDIFLFGLWVFDWNICWWSWLKDKTWELTVQLTAWTENSLGMRQFSVP